MPRTQKKEIYFDRKRLEFIGLDAKALQDLRDEFPYVEVGEEIFKMKKWLMNKGVRHKGTLAFITNWLSKSLPRPVEEPSYLPVLEEHLTKYLEDLWTNTNAQALFAMNMRSRAP